METKITSQYLNKEQMVLFQQYVEYCVRRFNLKKHGYRLKISICKRIDVDEWGNCVFDDSKDYDKEIKIKVRFTKNVKKMLTVLGHEMIHARQYITGQLTFINNRAHWRGENVHDMEYREQPHEIEAFSLEKPLLEDFYKARKKKTR